MCVCYAGVLVCQSGCVLQSLDDMLAKHDLMMPLDLGAKGRCGWGVIESVIVCEDMVMGVLVKGVIVGEGVVEGVIGARKWFWVWFWVKLWGGCGCG